MLEATAPGSRLPRAFLRIGGVTVARQQIGLALTLQCERVICLAHGSSPELAELQYIAESAGAHFSVIAYPRQLLGLVTTADEVIVLGDGLFVSLAEAAELLEQGQAVLVQPIEQGLAAGFERIDLNTASAAAMRIPGRLVERIAELPMDCDAASALQRIALQAGVRQRAIPARSGASLFWSLVRTEDEAHAIEPLWIRQRTRDDVSAGPARAIALLAVRVLGPAMLHAGSGAKVVTIAALAFALMGLGSGWLGWVGVGLCLCAGGWTLRETAALLARIESDSPPPVHGSNRGRTARRGPDSKALYGWMLDGIMITLAGWGVSLPTDTTMLHRFFPPLILVGLLRIMPRTLAGRWSPWFGDRAIPAVLLAIAIPAGLGDHAIMLGCTLLLTSALLLPDRAIH